MGSNSYFVFGSTNLVVMAVPFTKRFRERNNLQNGVLTIILSLLTSTLFGGARNLQTDPSRQVFTVVKAHLIDQESLKPVVGGTLLVYEVGDRGNILIQSGSDSVLFVVLPDQIYEVKGSAPGYRENKLPIDPGSLGEGDTVSVYLELTPVVQSKPPPRGINGNYHTVKIFYGTDRSLGNASEPKLFYANERGDLTYGTCEVSIPKGHRIGELEAPSIWRLEWNEDPSKHVVLLKVDKTSQDVFFNDLSDFIDQTTKKQAFVFVHGYNVTFDQAAKRTAQMAYDLSFDGAPILYSWPSKGNHLEYPHDEENIKWTEPHLHSFLKDIYQRSGASTIHLVAHSMGNRALTRAFGELSGEIGPGVNQRFREVILTAPDIDADIFKRDIAPKMIDSGSRITIYASSNDKALQLSRDFHGYPRAGDSGKNLVILPGIETIDVTDINTTFLGHSYFSETPSVISDLFYIINYQQPASSRKGLVMVNSSLGIYWKLK